MRDLIAGDCDGYLTLFLETGSGLHNAGHIQRDSSGAVVDIRVSANSFPFINDWDEDGRKDIIIGETAPDPPATGNVRVYINVGTNAAPVFRNHALIYAGGEPLFVDRALPVVGDLDGDSLKDLICGNTNGYLYFFKNLGTNSAPLFAAAYETLMTVESEFIDALTLSRSNPVDWTGDGDLDILLGGQDGYVWVCENANTTEIAEYENAQRPLRMTIAPNPCHGKVKIQFAIRDPQSAMSLKIYDASGRLVKSFDCLTFQLFNHIIWDCTDDMGYAVPAGVYFVKLTVDSQTLTDKTILLR